MASVNFEKYKDCATVYAKVLHSDKEMRKNKTHRNKHINTSLTGKNIQIANRGYADTCERFRNRIDELDKTANGNNKKAGRVLCFGLEIPAPEHLKDADATEWFKRVYEIICSYYGRENLINFYVHKDERHEYIDARTHERKMSRFHAHCYVVPEVDGKLNGKAFSSAERMREINGLIHQMSADEFGVQFMDGSKRSSRKTVEKLKAESEQLSAEQNIKAIREREQNAIRLQAEARKMLSEATETLSEARKEADSIKASAEQKASEVLSEAHRKADSMLSELQSDIRQAVTERNQKRQADGERMASSIQHTHTDVVKHK